MPKRATLVVLSEEERTVLIQLVKRYKSGQQQVLRAKMVLRAGEGQSNVKIAQELSVSVETVRLWRDRWVAEAGDGAFAHLLVNDLPSEQVLP